MARTTEEADVVVVGGGLSGLYAAHHLKKKVPSLKVVVLEAKDRVGGRTLTTQLKTAKGTAPWDLGGQWVARSQHRVLELIEELGLETHQQYVKGLKFQQLGDNSIRTYKGTIPALNPLALLDVHRFLSMTSKMANELDLDDPYTHPKAEEWDSMTLYSFAHRYAWTQAAVDTLGCALRTAFGVECNQVSLLYYLMYGRAAGGFYKLYENVNGGGQEFVIKGGAQQMSFMLVDKIGKENVRLSSPVTGVEQDDSGVTVTTEGGERVRASHVIMATPPHLTGKVNYTPCLPFAKQALFNRMPVSHMTKFIITYEKAFWIEKGYSGEIVSNGGEKVCDDCDTQPAGVICDHTIDDNPALVGFISGRQGLQWSDKPFEERKQAVLVQLSKFLGDEALTPIEYSEKRWHLEPYNGGCPIDTVPPGMMRYFSSGLREPFRRVHFAGTESSTLWCGFMDGAIRAGNRAATEVIYSLHPDAVSAEELREIRHGAKQARIVKTDVSQTVIRFFEWAIIVALIAVVFIVIMSFVYSD